LEAYGPFTGLTLDLSRGTAGGLHLIYGPNEAGKSSALRAIRDLLFGIPASTEDAYLHPGPALRLGALIERGDERLEFVRRKKRKDSLTTLDDRPLEEAQLARFLNGLDAASFDRLFGLNHKRLQQGGVEMLAGKGDVGEALFDAGASGRSVHRVKLALVEEADELFKDRAQKPELNRLLALYADQKKRAKDSVHSPEKYEEQLEHVREARRDVELRRAELGQLRAEKEHSTRLRNVLSSVSERDRKAAERALLGQVPSLPRDAKQQREGLLSQLSETERDATRLGRQLAERRETLASLPEPSALLGMPKDQLRSLRAGFGRVQKDLQDLPKRQAEARALREAIQAGLPRLGLGGDVESAARRALPVPEQARVQALGRESQVIRLKLESAEQELLAVESELLRLEASIAQARATRRIEQKLLLPPELPLRFEAELQRAREAFDSASLRIAELTKERAALHQQLTQLKGPDGVPSEALLAEARAEREKFFREAQELAADPKRKALELCLPLATLSRATSQADSLADRLRNEAKRVADAEALEQAVAKLTRERELSEATRESAAATLAEQQRRWRQASSFLSAAELSPREAGQLLQEEREAWRDIERSELHLARTRAGLGSASERLRQAKDARALWKEEWQAAVAPLGLPADARPEQVLALLEGLSELLGQLQILADKERRAEGIARDINEFTRATRAATQAFAPELSEPPAAEAADRLLEQHQRAEGAALSRSTLESEIALTSRELGQANARLNAQQSALAELCRQANVPDASALALLEERVLRAKSLDAELSALDQRLQEMGDGERVEALIAEARSSDPGAVRARLAELDDLISVREEEARERDRELTHLEVGSQIYQGKDAADAAQELSGTVARLVELSSCWARRRVASLVLTRVVESYRERHQGPVLSRASELFRRLTLGKYARLQVGLEDARLECVLTAEARALDVEQLSEGARYQLYLALKLASLEQYLGAAPPLPLVLDDVLIEWYDERAQVALSVLADFSDRIQVLLFTHHGRDVVAAERLGDGRIFTHQLPQRSLSSPRLNTSPVST